MQATVYIIELTIWIIHHIESKTSKEKSDHMPEKESLTKSLTYRALYGMKDGHF